jgi:outer membrane lipoprotein carrier protein
MSLRPLLLVLVLLAAVPATAEEPDIKAVIRALERHYNSVRTLEADFVQRYTLGANTVVESGHVYFLKPGRMRWDYTSPQGKLFLTDGDYAYFYSPAEGQVRRQSVKKAPQWQAVFALLLGRVDLSRLFAPIQLVRVHGLGTPARWQLRGQAKSARQGFHEVWLDLSDVYQLLRIEIHQSDGSLMEFHFRRWREQHSLPAELFRLQVPPGTVWLDEESF